MIAAEIRELAGAARRRSLGEQGVQRLQSKPLSGVRLRKDTLILGDRRVALQAKTRKR